MLARRLLIVLAVLIGLTALASGVAPPQPAVDQNDAPPPPPGTPGAAPKPIERTLDAGDSGQVIVARSGQTVIITVESETLDTVRLGEYGYEPVEAVSPARFELLADVPGSYPIELVEAERVIGTLEVRAAPEPAAEPARGVQS